VPLSSVSAPQPQSTFPSVVTESDGVLAKRIGIGGLCAPGAVSIVRAAMVVSDDDDPWFPVEDSGKPIDTGDRAIDAARRACFGCPVMAECRELARREESRTGDVYGIRGGLAADERRAAYRAATKGGDAR
jgi:transcription factor WhiB